MRVGLLRGIIIFAGESKRPVLAYDRLLVEVGQQSFFLTRFEAEVLEDKLAETYASHQDVYTFSLADEQKLVIREAEVGPLLQSLRMHLRIWDEGEIG